VWFVSYFRKVKGAWEPGNRVMKRTHPLEWAASHPEVRVVWWKALSVGERLAAERAAAARRSRRVS